MPLGHLGIPKLDKPQYYFKEDEKVDLKVIKMDVENRRIVLSIAERLKDFDEERPRSSSTAHPRLEDVVAAEAAARPKRRRAEDAARSCRPPRPTGYAELRDDEA